MYEKAQLAFEEYMKNYDLTNPLILLKYKHTYQVVELMSELAFRLNLSKDDMILAKVIGLLHDIGRFEQIKKYNVISDKKTNMDHAEYGYHYLFLEHHIKDFGVLEDTLEASIIGKSILNHNKYKIEDNLTKRELLFTKMIRDMDKVDIFRVLALKNHEVFKADEVSSDVLKEFSLNHEINNHLIKSETDKTVSRLAFVFDINFNESFDILVQTDNFDFYLSMVDVASDSEKLWKKLREICFDKINRGVGEEDVR